jgi:hypothetical protein
MCTEMDPRYLLIDPIYFRGGVNEVKQRIECQV